MFKQHALLQRYMRHFMAALALSCVSFSAMADVGIANRNVNFRAAPNLDSQIVGVLGQGSEALILELVPDGEFVRIKRLSDGKTGYLRLLNLDIRERSDADESTLEISDAGKSQAG